MIRIIGIGSPFGEDRVGLETAQRLADRPPAESEVVIADRPGLGLVDLLEGCDAAIVIDAVKSGAPPGTVHDFHLGSLRHRRLRSVSGHDLGVGTAVDLARELGHLPARGRLLGIETAVQPDILEDRLSADALTGVQNATMRAQEWASVFARRTKPF